VNPIRSPLAAVGALMVLIDGVVLGALNIVDDPELQKVIVWSLIGSMVAVILMVWWMLWYILVKLKEPIWLFSPSDIDASAHLEVYARGQRRAAPPPELTTIAVDEDSD
jgi:hypothetical protein